MNSIKFIPASCPNCGGELRVPENLKSIKCMYCGTEIYLSDPNKLTVESVINLDNYLKVAETAAKGNNFEEAYRYYSLILEQDANNSDAWLGKGYAAGMLSTYSNLRTEEVDACFSKGMEGDHEKKFEDLDPQKSKKIAEYYYNIAIHLSDLSNIENGNLDQNDLILFQVDSNLVGSYLYDNSSKELIKEIVKKNKELQIVTRVYVDELKDRHGNRYKKARTDFVHYLRFGLNILELDKDPELNELFDNYINEKKNKKRRWFSF